MKKIIYRSKAIQAVILIIGVCLLLSLWPLRLFKVVLNTSVASGESTFSSVIDEEKTLMQCFVAQYDHLDTIRLYLGEDCQGESFYLRILDPRWQMVCEEKTDIHRESLPGYQEILIDIDTEVGETYYCIVQGMEGSELFVSMGPLSQEEAPYAGALYYADSELEGFKLTADYNYIVPLRKGEVLLYGGMIAALTAILFLGAGKLFSKKDKLITVESAFKAVMNPIAAVFILVCLIGVLAGACGNYLLDNTFFFISVLLLGLLLFYGINHNRDGQEPVITADYIKSHGRDLLQSVFIAGAIGACCEYMSGLYDIHHLVAERKEMLWFALAVIAMFRWKEIVNLYNVVYLAGAGFYGYYYYGSHLTEEMNDAEKQALRLTIWIAVLLGLILIRTVLTLIRRQLSKPSYLYGGLLLLFFVMTIVFRNGRWWTVAMAVGCTLFYLAYGAWEHKDRLLVNVCRGVVLQFIYATGYALLHRPFVTFRTARYTHIFHTATITATYLTMVECVAVVLFLSKLAKSFKLRDVWKELTFFGVVTSYMLFTMARTGFFAVAVTFAFALLLMVQGKGREKVRNLGKAVGLLVLSVIICFPITFTVQRTIPALASDPVLYDIESYPEDILRGRKLNSVEFMRVGRFIDVFAEKIFGIPEGTFDIYGEIAAYNKEHGIDTALAAADPSVEAIELVASADYVPRPLQEEPEADYTNGRLDIFRSYLEQLNMTGHQEMGALLQDGERATHAHDIYLQVAYDHGIPVGILFVLVGLFTFGKAISYHRRRKGTGPYTVLPAVITLAVAVAGLVEWIFHISNPCGLVFLLVISPLLWRGETENERKEAV